ncbi:MAG: hypothetical protein SF053_13620 [Bacteroidia bacterium]|nr:hypothetical protein [Bacteroidia bacterium]
MKHFLPPFLLLILIWNHGCTPPAPTWAGTYTGTASGEPLTLTITPGDGKILTGKLDDGYQAFDFEAVTKGDSFIGKATLAQNNILVPFTGARNAETLTGTLTVQGQQIAVTLQKQADNSPADPAAPPQDTPPTASRETRDPALAGTWEYQENRSDPFGGSSFNQRMVLFADGGFGDGGSDASVSGGGGSGLSTDNTVTRIPGVTWYTRGSDLYLTATQNGKTETEKLGKYFIQGGNMMITTDDGRKILFYRK